MGLFREADSPLLKAWIAKRLENPSGDENDIDVEVLADYVLALLSQEGSAAEIRALCEKELPELIQDKAPAIVADVFRVIEDESYLPENLRRPKPQAVPAQSIPAPFPGISWPAQPSMQPNGSRKRSYYDAAPADTMPEQNHSYGRPVKQPRRDGFGGRGGRKDNFSGHGHNQLPAGAQYGLSADSSGAIPFDPGSRLNAFATGMAPIHAPTTHVPAVQGFDMFAYPGAQQDSTRRKRRVCRDFAANGLCNRPNCPFEHIPQGLSGKPGESLFPSAVQPPPLHPYDSLNFSMGFGDLPKHFAPQFPSVLMPSTTQYGSPNSKNRNGRAAFSVEGPVHDRAKTTIVVENIPEESFSETAVRELFGQFGNIAEVSMQPYKRLALVKFDQWGSANAAYRSPKVMFDNRFVKVFWHKDDASILPPSEANGTANGDGVRSTAMVTGDAPKMGSTMKTEPDWDMESFLRQQDKAQRLYEERKQKLAELEQERQVIETRRKELAAKSRVEKEKLHARLTSKSGSAGSRSPSPEITTASSSEPSKVSAAIRAQLAALEAEARELGIDPDGIDEPEPAYGWSSGGRGRGHSNWRGRGFAPRGFRGGRGGYIGRGAISAAIAAYSLDNRPKTVTVSGVDFTVSENDEALRHYLLSIGDYASIESTSTGARVSFADRRTAEKLFNGLTAAQQLPGLEGRPVDVAWVTGSIPTSTTATATATKNTSAAASDAATPKHDVNGDMLMESGQDVEFVMEKKEDFDVAGEGEAWDGL